MQDPLHSSLMWEGPPLLTPYFSDVHHSLLVLWHPHLGSGPLGHLPAIPFKYGFLLQCLLGNPTTVPLELMSLSFILKFCFSAAQGGAESKLTSPLPK